MKRILLLIVFIVGACSSSPIDPRLREIKERILEIDGFIIPDSSSFELRAQVKEDQGVYYYRLTLTPGNLVMNQVVFMAIFESEREVATDTLYPSVGVVDDPITLDATIGEAQGGTYKGFSLNLISTILDDWFLVYLSYNQTENFYRLPIES